MARSVVAILLLTISLRAQKPAAIAPPIDPHLNYFTTTGGTSPAGDFNATGAWMSNSMLTSFPSSWADSTGLPVLLMKNDVTPTTTTLLCDSNIMLVQLIALPGIGVAPTTGNFKMTETNCMSDYGVAAGPDDPDLTWAGHCTRGDSASNCTWKNGKPVAYGNKLIIYPSRQAANGLGPFGDSTIATSVDAGKTWTSYDGHTSVNGAAPIGPCVSGTNCTANSSYPASVMFQVGGNGVASGTNPMQTIHPVVWGQDGSYPTPSASWCDPHVYICGDGFDMNQATRPMVVWRVPIASATTLSSYQWYTCPGYSPYLSNITSRCNPALSSSWGSEANATVVFYNSVSPGSFNNSSGYYPRECWGATYSTAHDSFIMGCMVSDSVGGLRVYYWSPDMIVWYPASLASSNAQAFTNFMGYGANVVSTTPPVVQFRDASGGCCDAPPDGNSWHSWTFPAVSGQVFPAGDARRAYKISSSIQTNMGHRFTMSQTDGAIPITGPALGGGKFKMTWWFDGWDASGDTSLTSRYQFANVLDPSQYFRPCWSDPSFSCNFSHGWNLTTMGLNIPASGFFQNLSSGGSFNDTVFTGNASWTYFGVFRATQFGAMLSVGSYNSGSPGTPTFVTVRNSLHNAGDICVQWGANSGPTDICTPGGAVTLNQLYAIAVTAQANGSGFPTLIMYTYTLGVMTTYPPSTLTKNCTTHCSDTPSVSSGAVAIGFDAVAQTGAAFTGDFGEFGAAIGAMPANAIRAAFKAIELDWRRLSRGQLYANAVGISVTNTEATLTYNAPSTSPCSIEVSESPTFSPVVKDVDGSLFSGANLDSRPDTLVDGLHRIVKIGSRLTGLASDSRNYSRALQAFTTHYVRLCGTLTTQFTTANIPYQMTYQDIPQVDPSTPGGTMLPTIQDNPIVTYIDPHTGAKILQATFPGNIPYTPGNSNTYGEYGNDTGFIFNCGENLVGPGPGFLCGFPQGNGGPGTLVYVVPSTGASTYLGRPGLGFPFINRTDSKFYIVHNNTDIIAKTYTGSYTAASPGANASMTSSNVLLGFNSAIVAFDATFDPSSFACGDPSNDVGVVATGDYIPLQCKRGGADTYGWFVIIKISTASVVAAGRFDSNIKTRWCAIHQSAQVYDQPGMYLEWHPFVPETPPLGGGPYGSTLSGNISAGTTSITVSGDPTCPSCGTDTQVAPARTGDYFQFQDAGNEVVQITNRVSPTSWQITATANSHSSGVVLNGWCTGANNHTSISWKFLADPHMTDTTNTNYIASTVWDAGGHDSFTTGLHITEASGYPVLAGDLMTNLGNAPTNTITTNPAFAGANAQCFGNGCVAHPSTGPSSSGKFTDFYKYDGAGADNATFTLQTGQIYKITHANTYPVADIKHFAIAGVIATTNTGGGGPFAFRDISGVGSTLPSNSSGNYEWCRANAINECISGSAVGDEFVNLPGSPITTCSSDNSPCLNNFNAFAQGVIQSGTATGTLRLITNGLTGLRSPNFFPTAKTLNDGSYAMFAVGNVDNSPPSRMFMVKMLPDPISDGVDRTTFIRAAIHDFSSTVITPPAGVTTVLAEFGYVELGTAAQHYCTSRQEACVAVSSTVNDTTPFYYEITDSYSRLACTTSSPCQITIPVKPMQVAHWQVFGYNSGGTRVWNGPQGMCAESSCSVLQ